MAPKVGSELDSGSTEAGTGTAGICKLEQDHGNIGSNIVQYENTLKLFAILQY